MKNIERVESELSKTKYDTYELDNYFEMSDIPNALDLLEKNNIKIKELTLQNSDEDMGFFHRRYKTLKDFYFAYNTLNEYFDELGVDCEYNDVDFSLSFSIGGKEICAIHIDEINLEPLIQGIDDICQKKSNTKSH